MADVAVVAPVRVQKADSVILAPVAAHGPIVLVAVLCQGQPAVPRANAGTDVLGRAHLGQIADFVFPLLGQITPVQADHAFGNFRVGFRVPPHDVAPEHGGHALRQQPAAQLHHVGHVKGVLALFVRQRLAAALAQIEGLIAADVELFGREQGAVFRNQALDEIHGPGVGDVQGVMVAGVSVAERDLFRIGQFAQVAAGFGAENLVHVAEAGQRRNQFDVPGTAVTIQFHDLLGSEGRVIPPRFAQVAEKIRMLDVQLPFVDLVAAQEIGVALECFQRGHPAPGAV